MSNQPTTHRIPTVAETMRALRRLLPGEGVTLAEAGTREGSDGDITANAADWPEQINGVDNDLFDLVTLGDVFKEWRKSPPLIGAELDLYVRAGWLNDLLTNVALYVTTDGFSVSEDLSKYDEETGKMIPHQNYEMIGSIAEKLSKLKAP